MSLTEVVNCAPFRLDAPRPLTAFEWAVVQTAVARSMDSVQFGLGRTGEPAGVVEAMQKQPCLAWRTSLFGPAPAVATYWVKCFARWYAGFDIATRFKILADVGAGLLCSAPSPPWMGCKPEGIGAGPADLWEGGPQVVDPGLGMPSSEPCAFYRHRTVYTPVTGRELVKMMQFLGPDAQIPPAMAGMVNAAPSVFLDRKFLLGIQAKKQIDPTALPPEFTGAALAVLEEAALIWGPGKGASLLELFQGPIDPAKLAALFAKMSPDLLGDLGTLLPGILQTAATSPELAGMFATAAQMLPGLFGATGVKGFGAIMQSAPGQPGTKPVTGIPLIDMTASQLATMGAAAPPLPSTTEPAGESSASAGAATGLIWAGVVVAVVGLAALWASRRDR